MIVTNEILRMKFTGRTIAALVRDPDRDDYVVWNEDLPAMGIRLRGNTKVYINKPRVNGRLVTNTIGDVRKMSLENAVKIARQHFAEARLGIHAAGDKAKARAAAKQTLGATADRYLQIKQRTLRASSYKAAVRYFTVHWAPLRSCPLDGVGRRDIAMRLQELTVQNGRTAAARARDHLSTMYAWAMGEGLVDANPVIGTNDPEAGIASRDRTLTDRELAAVWKSCDDDEFGAIIKLLTLTGCRRQEIGGLRWSEIDFETGVLTLPSERTKNGRILQLPLPLAALDILRAVPRRSTDYVFGRDGFSSWSVMTKKLNARIAASGVTVAPWHIHDLRRSMRTNLGRLGVPPHVAELCINHVRQGMIGVYDRHNYQTEIGDALRTWSDHVTAVVEGRERKLLPMKKRA
jgi:integrase